MSYGFDVIDNKSPLWPDKITCTDRLWYAGDLSLLSKDSVSIVGTRQMSEKGRNLSQKCVDLLCGEFVIVSGLALGIDGTAHARALSNNSKTIAVIGTPIDCFYPKEHEQLQQLIAEKGLVISQFEIGTKTERYCFMKRNLLMSQISRASVVIEDPLGGGAMGHASYALKQGRKVFVFDFENYKALKGSVLVSSPEEIVRILHTPETVVQPELF